MKILFVCAAGMSTGILTRKLEHYIKEHQLKMVVDAVGLSEYEEICHGYDVILIGPQISYQIDEIRRKSGLPVAKIPALDYSIGNCENIIKLVNKLQKGEK
ncbi:PTS sugar transporter subunit IIB [Xylocopilactobacillus apicola]|uniref:PTS sugar transporter subunit IIB n=1 Tax=Xylocopilactobacillus apicola TaxID=2932184 RepID=A0AAU9CUC2_9LACO|nr:PTS sugar transporter subunit IIB [Xylocopilactobacillus apicola]BDR57592.1 PTS sugar transporter subunit IIB [Xylocopilactobacillus apicola]